MASKLTDYHVRGMTDTAGSPGTAIATEAVEHWSDGSVRYADPNGNVIVIRDAQAKKLLEDVLSITLR